MPEKSILIIGAGIGGLSTGCYARINGYRAAILEMHTTPGGLCTSWKRHGYTFDGSIHNLGEPARTAPFIRYGASSASCRRSACTPTRSLSASSGTTAHR